MDCHLIAMSVPSSPRSNGTHRSAQTISSDSATIATLFDVIRRLRSVYNKIEEIMRLPSSQATPASANLSKGKHWRTSSSALFTASSLQRRAFRRCSVLPKKGAIAVVEAKIHFQSYIRFAKKTQKPFKKISSKSTLANQESCREVKLLGECRDIVVSVVSSRVLVSYDVDADCNTKSSKWSLIYKTLHTRGVVCEVGQFTCLGVADC